MLTQMRYLIIQDGEVVDEWNTLECAQDYVAECGGMVVPVEVEESDSQTTGLCSECSAICPVETFRPGIVGYFCYECGLGAIWYGDRGE